MTWTEDAAGRGATPVVAFGAVERPDGSRVRYRYEGANRIAAVEEDHHGTGPDVSFGYTLDDNGNTTARTVTTHDATDTVETTHFAYDGQNQLDHVSKDGAPSMGEYAYDERGRRTRHRAGARDVNTYWDDLSVRLQSADPFFKP